MYNIINNGQKTTSNSNLENEYSLIDLLPKQEETNMKSELKNFLKSQLDNSKTNENRDSTDISALDYMSNSNSYSNY
jgi:hypothetical protein